MAIEPTMADMIRQMAVGLPNRRVLSLGYPDILTIGAPPEDPGMQSISRWHHWQHGIQSADAFFAELNLQPEYWDVTKARGPERIVDLNSFDVFDQDPDPNVAWEDIGNPPRYARCYGMVIDPGTIEHIANIGNCFRMVCETLAIGGIVIHCNPFGWANHGMYSIHPTAYLDIYEANGFEVETLAELSGPLESRTVRDVKTVNRFQAAGNSVMLCVARKVRDVAFQFPTQSKYRINPNLKAAQ